MAFKKKMYYANDEKKRSFLPTKAQKKEEIYLCF